MSALDRIRTDVRHGYPVSNKDAGELLEQRDELESQMLAARSSSRARELTIAVLNVRVENAERRARYIARELEHWINREAAA